jgi:hypothetical protein
MIYFSYQKGYLSTDFEIQEVFKKKNKIVTTLSKKSKKELAFLHSKWITFGGGFYGLIASLTFIIIELLQVLNFWLNITGWQDIIALFKLDTIIAMVIDFIINMIKAALWFTYWPSKLDTDNFLAWILVAYICYRFAGKYAMRYAIAQKLKSEEST